MQILWPEVADSAVRLAANDAHVWAVPLTYAGTLDELRAILSPQERRRADQFRVDVPRRRFIVSRAALRVLLGRYINLPATAVALNEGKNGKPQLAQQMSSTPLFFNVAHSDELALIAIANGCEIGIDVEQLRTVSHWKEIASRYYHDAETRAILALPPAEQATAFLQCWTSKEAVLKALGVGLSGSLTSYQVTIRAHDGEWLQVPNDGMAPATAIWLQQLQPHRDYAAAIAVIGEKRIVRCFRFAWRADN